MVSIKNLLVAGFVSIATAAKPSANFTLSTAVTSGNTTLFNGLYLVGFHTGAGQSAVATTKKAGNAAVFYLKNGQIFETQGTPGYPAGLALAKSTPYNSTAPDDYDTVTLNIGKGTPKFSFFDKKGSKAMVSFSPSDKFEFQTFAICKVNGIAPYQSVGPQIQLLWRDSDSAGVYGKQCADVRFIAEFVRPL